MREEWLFGVTLATALGCALVAGVFFAFSTFVMKALGQLPPAQGIAAMQSINVTVINPWFMGVFLGTAAACLFLAVSSLLHWSRPGAGWLLAGALLYLLGTMLVTMAFHVPRNDALAAVVPSSAEGTRMWAGYLASWTIGNHVRTAAALAAAVALLLALGRSRGAGGS
jgi:uncharacterized membrane protein